MLRTATSLCLPLLAALTLASSASARLDAKPPQQNGPLTLYVDGAHPNCSSGISRSRVSTTQPWCLLADATAKALPGDTVQVAPHTYKETMRPRSGTAALPIRYIASAPGVIIDAAGRNNGLQLISVTDVSIDGFAVSGALVQGAYFDAGNRVTLSRMTISGNGDKGVQVLRSSQVTIADSTISANKATGIMEGSGVSGNSYLRNTIQFNGNGGSVYNGDGIQFNGAGTRIIGNTIQANGDPGPYEHGIYAGAQASGYLIESNTLSNNAASQIKAAGSGVVRYNLIGSGLYGIVFSDNPAPVEAYYNLVRGVFQHAVFFTKGTTVAQAKLWNNTVDQQGRSSIAGDASAVFVNQGGVVELRNNLIGYSGTDNYGIGFWVNNAAYVASLSSNNNWFFSADSLNRVTAWNGTRATLASWQTKSGGDSATIGSAPPLFDLDGRVLGTNPGLSLGAPLGLTRDLAGAVVGLTPDLGAYETP